jgi:hypothetical protein
MQLLASVVDEHVFKRWFTEGDRINLTGKRFDELWDEFMRLRTFQPESPIDDLYALVKALGNLLC